MDRRDFLELSAATLAGAGAAAASAEEAAPHHHHAAVDLALVDAASRCVARGDVCLTHCHELLAQGDKTLGECAKSVTEMLALCSALRSLLAQNAPSAPRVARIAADVCKNCEDACRKHEKEHEVCKACGEACADCGKECRKIAV